MILLHIFIKKLDMEDRKLEVQPSILCWTAANIGWKSTFLGFLIVSGRLRYVISSCEAGDANICWIGITKLYRIEIGTKVLFPLLIWRPESSVYTFKILVTIFSVVGWASQIIKVSPAYCIICGLKAACGGMILTALRKKMLRESATRIKIIKDSESPVLTLSCEKKILCEPC